MLTSKQRATLRGIASSYETILQVGKNGIGDTLIQQVSDALRKRELIKLHVLENSELSAREAAEQLAEATESEVVQVIGSRTIVSIGFSSENRLLFSSPKMGKLKKFIQV